MKTLGIHCSDCSATGGHSARCRMSWVCLYHHATVVTLMVLQYVTASFHLPSESTAHSKRVQRPKPHKQYEIPTIPAVVISKVLFPHPNITAAFVHSNSSCFSVSPGLPTYSNNNCTQFTLYTVRSLAADTLSPLHPSVQLPT